MNVLNLVHLCARDYNPRAYLTFPGVCPGNSQGVSRYRVPFEDLVKDVVNMIVR